MTNPSEGRVKGIWLETPYYGYSGAATAPGLYSDKTNYGIRPVIEVPLSEMLY